MFASTGPEHTVFPHRHDLVTMEVGGRGRGAQGKGEGYGYTRTLSVSTSELDTDQTNLPFIQEK
jgi:hypothetical protein